MPLFVLRIADDGAAKADGRLSVGDQIIEINGVTTHLMTHAQVRNRNFSHVLSARLRIRKFLTNQWTDRFACAHDFTQDL